MNIISIIVLILKWLAISVEYIFFLCGWHLEHVTIINGNLKVTQTFAL